MENATHAFRETNLMLQHLKILQIKNKTVMSSNSRKKKECIFATFFLPYRHFFSVSVFYLNALSIEKAFKIYIPTFTYQRTLLHKLFRFSLKSSKAFSVYLIKQEVGNPLGVVH